MVKRTHLASSKEKITLREVSVNDENARRGSYKPAGFWYEVDGDWRRWCEAEDYFTVRGDMFLHQVTLNDCNVLLVDSLQKLDDFHNKYKLVNARYHGLTTIDWVAVSKEYDGVEIAPYQWDRRLALDFMWYYGWDCASGVIWRPKNAEVALLSRYEKNTTTVTE